MDITTFDGAFDKRPSNYDLTFDELAQMYEFASKQTVHRGDKLSRLAFILGKCEGYRANANIRHLSAFAADIDTPPDDPRYLTFDETCEMLSGYAYIAHSTTTNCDDHHRFRLIFPLPQPVPASAWLRVWQHVNQRLDGKIDPATKDPARLSFAPACWTAEKYHDSSKGQVTLNRPFNAFRANLRGEFFVDAATVKKLTAEALVMTGIMCAPTMNVSARIGTMSAAIPDTAAKSAAADAPSRLTGIQMDRLAKGYPDDWPGWAIYSSLISSPAAKLVPLASLAASSGSRDYRFMLSIACRSVENGFPISHDALLKLAEQFSQHYLKRSNDRLSGQAMNALSYVYHQHYGA